FHQAITSLDKLARQPHALSLLTDGARRSGHRLFALCHARGPKGKPGRPKKTCTKGGHVRLKHTGAQAQKQGRKRPTYPRPWRAHPATARSMAATASQANHADAFLRALRRPWATFRRKTNREAQATQGWQRL